MKILILEDYEPGAALMQEAINCRNNSLSDTLQIRTYDNYNDALYAITSMTFDWAIVDYDLGTAQTGIDFIYKIAKIAPWTKRILYTGMDVNLELRQKIESCPCDYSFQKPIIVDKVLSVIFDHREETVKPKRDTEVIRVQAATDAEQNTRIELLEKGLCRVESKMDQGFDKLYTKIDQKGKHFVTTLISVGALMVAAIGVLVAVL